MFKSIIAAIGTKATVAITSVVAVAAAAAITAAVVFSGEESYRVLKVFELNGSAAVTRESAGELEAYVGMNLESGDVVTVNSGTMRLSLDNNKYILLEEGTVLELVADGTASDSKTTINLREGAILNEITESLSSNSLYEVNAPKSTMAVRGTSFYVSARQLEDGSYIIDVTTFHGKVSTQLYDENGNKKGSEIIVKENQSTKIKNENTGSGHAENDGTAYYVIVDNETGELRPVADGETPTYDTVYIDVPDEIKDMVLNSDNTDLLSLSADVLNAMRGISEETEDDEPAETTATETTPAETTTQATTTEETTAATTSSTTTSATSSPFGTIASETPSNQNVIANVTTTTAGMPIAADATTASIAETTTTTAAATTTTAASTTTAATTTTTAATTTEATTTTTTAASTITTTTTTNHISSYTTTSTAASTTTTAASSTTTTAPITTTAVPVTTATMTLPETTTTSITTTETSATTTSATLTTTPAATTTTEETTTAEPEPETVNVTFNYGESTEVVPVTIGEAIGTIPSVPAKTGYTGKWVIKTGDETTDLTTDTVIMSDTVITILYTPIEYTISYVASYDETVVIAEKTIAYNEEIPRIDIPDESMAVDTDGDSTMNYMVWGWEDKAISTTVTGNETIVVPYVEYNKIVEVRINTGSEYVSKLLEAGTSYDLPEKPTNNAEKEADGYVFRCWTGNSGTISSSIKPGRTSFNASSCTIEGGGSLTLSEGSSYDFSPTFISVSGIEITAESGDSVPKDSSTQLNVSYSDSDGYYTVPAHSGDITYTLTGYTYSEGTQIEVTLSEGTTITSDGLLTIASDETASVIKITATSAKFSKDNWVMLSITTS